MTETIRNGALYIISTPIGNLDDISRRALGILGAVDVVAAEDTRKSGFLLDHYSIRKPLLSYHGYNERRRAPELIRRLKEGQSVAVVTDAGTPGISDPAAVVIRDAIAEGIPVIPVPGASALLAALVVSGLPTERFAFEGFLPVKKGRNTRLEQLKNEDRTIVLYESPHRLGRTLEDLFARLGDRRVAVVREVTKKFEEIVRGSLSDVITRLRQKAARGEYVIVLEGRSGVRDNDETEALESLTSSPRVNRHA